MKHTACLALGVVAFVYYLSARPPLAQGMALSQGDLVARIDRLFEQWDTRDSPGCALSVGRNGRPIVTRTYGMANLEFGVPIEASTIFEAGSVAKQVTAASIMLLVQDGRVSLDDPVRKFVPEVPDFGAPITIRHLLNHTSGLRCQWALLRLVGRPLGTAVHTVDEILDLVSRQKRLNFPPGDEFLYSNTGYTLLALVVQRASGRSLAEFSDARLFKPLGMKRTGWRTDHSTIVKARATAYAQDPDGTLHTDMPFTNVYGNGGLLTTVGDLLIWNNNLDSPRVGGRQMVDELETLGRLNDGFVNQYAKGLIVFEYRGVREISHGGTTGGYRAFVARFPDRRVSVSLLCNLNSINTEVLAHQVAEIVLEGEFQPRRLEPPVRVAPDELKALEGLYRNPATDGVLLMTLDKDRLRAGGAELVPVAADRFRDAAGAIEFVFKRPSGGGPTRVRVASPGARPVDYVSVPPFEPSPAQLAEFAGAYSSEELDVTYQLLLHAGRMFVLHRHESPVAVLPLYADAFDFGGGRVIRFTRAAAGRVDGFEIFADRARHVRFVRR